MRALSRLGHFKFGVLAVLVLAALVRLAVLAAVWEEPARVVLASDTSQYLELARELAASGRWGIQVSPTQFRDEAQRMPGYPLLLAALIRITGNPEPLRALVIVHALLGVIVTWGVILLARRLIEDRGLAPPPAALIAGLLYAAAPISIVMTGFGYSEILFSLWMMAAALAAVQAARSRRPWVWNIAAGLLYGLAVMTRPIGIPLLPLLILLPLSLREQASHDIVKYGELFGRRGLGGTLALLLGFGLIVGGWMTRNWIVFGRFDLSTIGDYNLFYYNAASLESRRLGLSLEEARAGLYEQLETYRAAHPSQRGEWSSLAEGAVARQVIGAHPIRFVWVNGLDALNGLRPGFSFMISLFGGSDDRDPIAVFMTGDPAAILSAMRGQEAPILALEVFMLSYLAAVIPLALTGCLHLALRREWGTLILVGAIPALLLYLPGLASNARFRAPVEPFLAMAAVIGGRTLWHRLVGKRRTD